MTHITSDDTDVFIVDIVTTSYSGSHMYLYHTN